MGICVFGLGDCGTTSKNEQIMTTSTVNDIMMSMTTTKSTNVTSTVFNNQIADVEFGNIINSENIGNITQALNSTQSVTINLNFTSTQDLRAQVENALKKAVSNSTTQKQGVLTTASTD